MANFKQHISLGSFLGFFLAVGTYLFDWVHSVYMAVLIFFATIVGSFLPDVDSQTSEPVKIIFDLYAYATAALTIYYIHDNGLSFYWQIFLPLASFFFVKIVLRTFFFKYATHRGIFHSLPAFLISFLLTLLVAWTTDLYILEKFSLALAVSIGYLSHLVLDELFSINLVHKSNTTRMRSLRHILRRNFGVKKSFGTALDLGFNNKSKLPALAAYTIIIILIISDFKILKQIFYNIF